MHEKDLCTWKMKQWKQKWNIKTDRGQRVYEKSDPEWNILKNRSFFLHFLLMTAKISLSFGKMFKLIWKILFSTFRKCYGLLNSKLPLVRYQILKNKSFWYCCWLSSFLNILILNITRILTLLPILFSERTFSNFLLSSTQKTKNEPFLF